VLEKRKFNGFLDYSKLSERNRDLIKLLLKKISGRTF